MSIRARQGLPEYTQQFTPSQLHSHLHQEAYADMEGRFTGADARRKSERLRRNTFTVGKLVSGERRVAAARAGACVARIGSAGAALV